MVIFLLAAFTAYVAYEPLSRWWNADVRESDSRAKPRILRCITFAYYWCGHRRRAIVAVAALLALCTMLLVVGPNYPPTRVSRLLRFVLQQHDGTQAMLGVVAGIVCRTFPTWTLVGGLGSRSSLFAFVGIVATIALVALLEPYLGRLRVFETPYAKLQFATPAAERQLELDIQRDLAFYEGLSSVTRTAKIVQLDCGYEAIESGGIDRFKKGDLYQAFAGALAVRSEIVDFLVRVANAERQGYDPEGLRRRVSPVADKFYALISGGWSQNDSLKTNGAAYEFALTEMRAQRDLLSANGIGNGRDGESTGNEPTWCEPYSGQITDEVVRNVLDKTRYVYGAVAVMFAYTGNTEGVIKTYEIARTKHRIEDDINVTSGLAESLYVGERGFADVSRNYETALHTIDTEAGRSRQSCEILAPKSEVDADICKNLAERYSRARLNIKLRLAYLWAQEGVRWVSAQQFAQENIDELRKGNIRPFSCLDDYEEINVKDTFAYLKLSFQAHTNWADNALDLAEVREARWLLEEVAAQLQDRQLNNDHTHQCLYQEQTKLWLRRVRSHLKLADTILQRGN